ncbi:hypothetical protein [Pelosinus propionicus]|uniref:Uncharacterized protein n=1 Tax=Pelosinus propionicus DSM 13327 TaxID=1123291 RepID=A0A1I4N1S9_9FIRM|nr:hypothetical protein [Pelosinus propionicus]SFM09479.1 hypothetical protein SAMN04490355_104043 [Pelosinus propionicus DSM 13327]
MAMTREEIAELRGRDKKEARHARLGNAVEKRFEELREYIPCKGVYQSNPCRKVENDKSGCVLKYYCEFKLLEKSQGVAFHGNNSIQ